MLKFNNFVDDADDVMNMICTPEDSEEGSPTNAGGRRSMGLKHNPMGGKFDPVAQSDNRVFCRISGSNFKKKASLLNLAGEGSSSDRLDKSPRFSSSTSEKVVVNHHPMAKRNSIRNSLIDWVATF